MPSDDSPDFRLRQSEHADRIRTERTVMEMTGLNRSQVRRLRAQLTNFADRVTTAKHAQKTVTPPPFEAKRSDLKVGGSGFGGDSKTLGPRQTAQAVGAYLTWNVIVNGQRATAEFDSRNIVFL